MKIFFRTTAKACQSTNSRKFFNTLGISIVLVLFPGCAAQQSDLARIQKDVEQQIAKIKEEKKTLGLQVEENRAQLTKMQAEAQRDYEYFHGKLEILEREIINLKLNKMQLKPEEN